MKKVNVYVDGTWLFKQCSKGTVLSTLTANSDVFYLDFIKLRDQILQKISTYEASKVEIGSMYYFTSIIKDIPAVDRYGKDLSWLNLTSIAKGKTVENARNAGFNVDGVFIVPFQHWMPERIKTKTFQEKMVDTSLVARTVKECLENPDEYHVIISGDLDMLPAITLVYPHYLETMILITTNPIQWDPNQQQTSKKLADYSFKYGPIYLEDIAENIYSGINVVRCNHCQKIFSTTDTKNRICNNCLRTRPARK